MRIFGYISVWLLALNSYAGSIECIGKVDRIFNHKNGRLAITSVAMFGDSSGRDICNLITPRGDVPVEICKTWLSQLLVSYSSGKNARIVYSPSAYT